ncbi:MAG: efflux RND transporter periplasmic adaptor subunit [Pseudomonadales bacterium]|nr:efflux RND transporter periplasmic adaptor subunit [Pseudomonadales bacterium]
MKTTYVAAILVALAFALWLLSGQLGRDEDASLAPSLADARDATLAMGEDAPVRVRARVVRAESQTADVVVRGRTEADRTVDVRAETTGRVVALPVEKGDRVDTGALLCSIDVETRKALIEESRRAVEQAQIEYSGATKLAERGYQSETAIAAARTRLAAATAELEQRELDLARTEIRAPFAGVVETRPVEIGDYLQPGAVCARIVDPDPMMLVGEVAERDVARVQPGDPGYGRLITGQDVEGTVAFVARTANPTTRTFRVEVAVPNADAQLRDGVTAEMRLPVERFEAHRVPSALLALDDAGDLGLRILDEDNIVRFVRVEVVKDAGNGIWVKGLPRVATIITVGQELVTAGQQVEATFEPGPGLPASAPGAESPTMGPDGDRAIDPVATPASSATPAEGDALAAAAA